jgi:hypothetical protein
LAGPAAPWPTEAIRHVASSSINSRFSSICRAGSLPALIVTVIVRFGSTLCSLRRFRSAPTTSWIFGKMCSAASWKPVTFGHAALISRSLGGHSKRSGKPRFGRTSLSFQNSVSVMNGIIGCISRSDPSSTAASTFAV